MSKTKRKEKLLKRELYKKEPPKKELPPYNRLKKYFLIFLFFAPIVLSIVMFFYMQAAKESATGSSYLTGAGWLLFFCGVTVGLGLISDFLFNAMIKESADLEVFEKPMRIMSKIFAFVLMGVFYWFYWNLNELENHQNSNACFDYYNTKSEIRKCIEEGGNVPGTDTNPDGWY